MSLDRFKTAGNGHSAQIKTPDGKIHNVPEQNEMVGHNAPASVGASASLKYNINTKDPKTGNFIGVSLQVSAWTTMPCTPETADITYTQCQDFIGSKVVQSRAVYVKCFNLEDWFGS